jgi:hypothetical protein
MKKMGYKQVADDDEDDAKKRFKKSHKVFRMWIQLAQ